MIKQSEILKAARDKLKTIADLPIYLDEVLENYENPCFFLKLVKTTRADSERANRNQNECLMIVTYFAQKGVCKALELYDIQDAIIQKFWRGLQVGKRWIHFQELQSDIDGEGADIVSVAMQFNYFDADQDDEEINLSFIRRIGQKERLKPEEEYYLKIMIGDDENGKIENANS
ncbi:MAG: hypothetical protein IJ728_02835 [Selenomonadaceae bacterium]|nr:hypothetical protein [Selenomonadaceae bacterium]MBR1728441.1 hypothetical protein [Selenomonadaceae bacterium]